MKSIILSFITFTFIVACSNPYSGVSLETKSASKKAISSVTPERAAQLQLLLEQTPKDQKEGMAYLIGYMPQHDLDTLSVTLLAENVKYAYKARTTFPWTKDLPEDIFLNEVLPYVTMDETRENWRKEFYDMLYPLVKNKQTINQAIDTVNKALIKLVNVEYNTKRNKANQAPYESMEIGMASCSGLSILLTDAFRAVGIPSRIAGTPMWVTREGNHNWSEVYIDGEWLFAEYYYAPLNHGWFLSKAAMADDNDSETWIYATSYRPMDIHFPMVWDRKDKSIGAVNVTQRYRDTHAAQVKESRKGTLLNIKMYINDASDKTSQNRVKTDIKVSNSKGEVIAEGSTVDITADMNDYFSTTIEDLEDTYTIEWVGKTGNKTKKIKISEETTLELSFE